MAFFVLTDCRIYWAGADLTGYSNKVELSADVEDLDATTFGSGGYKERKGGLRETKAGLSVLWDAGDGGKPDDRLFADLGVAAPFTAVPTSGAVGSLAYLTKLLESKITIGGKVGALVDINADGMGDQVLVRGVIMHPQGTARTATGSGTAVQLGAVAAGSRLWTALHVLSISGTATPTLTVRVQSDDNSGMTTPTTQVTFAAATAIGGQFSSVVGAITDDWWRADWTISGTNPSFLFAVSAGIAVP